MNIFINPQSDKGAPVLQAKKKQLGREAAGWNAAARELKTSVPAWVKRHSAGEGHITICKDDESCSITVANSVPYSQDFLPPTRGVCPEYGEARPQRFHAHIEETHTPLHEMNPHTLTETLHRHLVERLPGLAVHTPLDNGELLLPYALVEATADSERVPGNGTWDMTVSLELHTNAHEQDGEEARYSGADVVQALCAAGARKALNEAAEDFYLYSLKLAALDRAEVLDDSFIQHAEFRAVVQF